MEKAGKQFMPITQMVALNAVYEAYGTPDQSVAAYFYNGAGPRSSVEYHAYGTPEQAISSSIPMTGWATGST